MRLECPCEKYKDARNGRGEETTPKYHPQHAREEHVDAESRRKRN